MSNGIEIIKDAECVLETDKAIMVINSDEMKYTEHWIPKSVIHDNSEVWKIGQTGRLVVKYRWAESYIQIR